MRAMTGRTARDTPCGIPIFDEAYDIGIAGGDGVGIESPLGQSGKMRRDVGHLVVIKVLNDGGHDITDAGAILEVMQLLIDAKADCPDICGNCGPAETPCSPWQEAQTLAAISLPRSALG